ncbi:hypothetical protein NP493_361g02020 [Ridgeia piscesae]|uniref:Uncharacterized protein n=1 Tax=Ridgeia piscesae TaxID=27915 RepID=A0AAD9NTW1_RIDPI|nr:hypothetical protein NP493_361g02020 [Ridgeia piscesae]
MSPPLCRRNSGDSPQCSNERLPETRGGDANNWNSRVNELPRARISPTVGWGDKQDTIEFDRKDIDTDLVNSGRMNERWNSHAKSDSSEQDRHEFNSASTGLQFHGHTRSQSSKPRDDPTETQPPIKR